MRTIEAIIDQTGKVQLLESVELSSSHRALVTILEDEQPVTSLRPFGLGEGELVVPDDFDEPLSDEILDAFEKI